VQEALTLEALRKNVKRRYDKDEERVVGIMLARYDIVLTQRLIEECYTYWDKNSGKYFDIFWAGYGAYLPEHMESADKTILRFNGNLDRVYFDREAYIGIKDEFYKIFDTSYRDSLKLILVNYRGGELHFDESLEIDLEENLDANNRKIRDIMEFVTMECRRESTVHGIARKLRLENIKESIKGITLSEVIKAALKLATKQ
jgi:hypothetical protein